MMTLSPGARALGFAAAAGALLAAAPARAADTRGYAELTTGFTLQAGDGAYRDVMRPSAKVGFHALYLPMVVEKRERRLGFEIGGDFVPYRDDFVPPSAQFGQIDFYRVRLLGGVRYLWDRTPGMIVFGRALVGLDLVGSEETSRVAGLEVHDSDVDVGFGGELGAGALWRVGPVMLGAQLAVPVAFQADDGAGDTSVYDADWLSVDVDLLITLGTRL